MKSVIGGIVGVITCLGLLAAGPVEIDRKFQPYKPEQRVAGDLRTVGSDTLSNLVLLWAQQFSSAHPGVKIQVEAKGSSTGPAALMEGQAQFAPMSRAMKNKERDEFIKKFGYEPVALRVAIDCLAIYVNKDCPLDEISMPQIREVFSVDGPDMTWGQLGVTDPRWRDRPISLYGRNAASGTYGFFKSVALGGSDYKPSVKEAPGSAGVIQGVASDPLGMGYSGIGFRTPDVKVLHVAPETGDEAVEPTQEAANYGEYPLARNLYIYVNYDRNSGLDPLRAEFVRLIYSRDGQESVIKDGFFPVSSRIAIEDMGKVGLEFPTSKEQATVPSNDG
ncbi:MAG: phosphate ABC transporter substrate-binding protein PstS family protein [Planctomycetota bacterium]|nr:MAG: phosphate ABC transporter substrate-binding protein PstS family protein [Planctomycetota bacterium]